MVIPIDIKGRISAVLDASPGLLFIILSFCGKGEKTEQKSVRVGCRMKYLYILLYHLRGIAPAERLKLALLHKYG